MLTSPFRTAAARTGLILAGLAVAGCSGVGENTVVIGFTGPLSGGAAQYGKNVVRGLEMAVEEKNAAGGMQVASETYKVELRALDDRYYPADAATNARRLVQQNDAPAIFVPHSGGVAALQEFNTEPDTKFLIAAYTSEPQVLEARNPLTVMIPPRFDTYFEPFARTMIDQHGTRLGIVAGTHAYAEQWRKGFSETWRSLGGEVLSDNSVSYTETTDFTPAVNNALAEDPDVLFVGGPSQPTALVVEAARQQGFEGGFVVMDQAKFEEMEKIVPREMLNGSVGTMPLVELPEDSARQFVARYRDWAGEPEADPPTEIALNYEAMHIFMRAMELAGTIRNPHAIRQRMAVAARTLSNRFKPYETVGLTPVGQFQGDVTAAHVVAGEYQPMRIPQPYERASAR